MALTSPQLRLAAEREREVARLRALQEKAQDLQAEADAVRAKRIQDRGGLGRRLTPLPLAPR